MYLLHLIGEIQELWRSSVILLFVFLAYCHLSVLVLSSLGCYRDVLILEIVIATKSGDIFINKLNRHITDKTARFDRECNTMVSASKH